MRPFWRAAGIIIASRSAAAQWQAIRLHPSGAVTSRVYAVTTTEQYGTASTEAATMSAVWRGSAGTLSTWGGREINGVSPGGQEQVGYGGSGVGAALWHGSAGSLVSLHNPAWDASTALATSGTEQVGWYMPSVATGLTRAVLWRGSAASAVSLHPVNARASEATAAVPGMQGGHVQYNIPVGLHAVVWSGSPESMVDLTPPNNQAQVLGMAPGQQVGWAQPMLSTSQHAAMWSGTAASIVDLNPPGAGVSQLNATCGSAQVGYANLVSGGITAGIWFGTPESFVPLRPHLPPGYGPSTATSVAFDGERYYVGGWAFSQGGSGYPHAFLWIGVPAPATLALLAGAGLLAARRRRSAIAR